MMAGKRECLEETGLYVEVGPLLDVFAGQEHPRGAHIIIVYQAEVIGGELKAGDDVDDVAFFHPDNLPAIAFTTTKKILNIQ
jgi:ADP-ribose pyrophosphatase YjhB (NUDIX family)